MPTQTPMTAEAVFAGYDFRTNGGREGTTFYFNGHLTAEQVATTYSRTYPNPGAIGAYSLDPATARHAWHVFTEHEDDCYLAPGGDEYGPFDLNRDYDLCTCTAAHNRQNDGRGYEYRHPHRATPSTPGAIPITWVNAAW